MRAVRLVAIASALLPALAACGSLPSAGPSTQEIVDRFKPDNDPSGNQLGVHLVDLTPAVVRAVNDAPRPSLSAIDALNSNHAIDRIGPGDVLTVTIFETGAGLFTDQRPPSNNASADAGASGAQAGTSSTTLPRLQVDRNGRITVPYAGEIQVAGRSPTEVQRIIEGRLAGKASQPQVIVSVLTDTNNVVYVSGDLKNSGRIPLTLSRENVLDAIALAGGPTHPSQDMVVRVTRHGQTAQTSLTQVQNVPSENITLEPLDRIQVDYQPRTFLVFGATGKVAQTPFDEARVSLAEAVARSGGLDDQRANPESLFLFRFERPSVGRALGEQATGPLVPIIYRIDMRDPQNYFLAQQFTMQDKDLLYVANARTVQLYKFLQLINSIFEPIYISRVTAGS